MPRSVLRPRPLADAFGAEMTPGAAPPFRHLGHPDDAPPSTSYPLSGLGGGTHTKRARLDPQARYDPENVPPPAPAVILDENTPATAGRASREDLLELMSIRGACSCTPDNACCASPHGATHGHVCTGLEALYLFASCTAVPRQLRCVACRFFRTLEWRSNDVRQR